MSRAPDKEPFRVRAREIRDVVSLALALISFAAGVASLLRALRARRVLGSLEEEEYQVGASLPALSVVVPARNEARRLEPALGSLIGQNYPGDLEVVLVNDRSDDGTEDISHRLAREHPRLQALRVDELPPGWLGKNHAASVGAAETTGEWILFCDADVGFEPSALGRAVAYAEWWSLDHLTLVPNLELDGYWLRSVTAFSWMMGLVHVGLYRANVEGSGVGVGIGAFNLIRRQAYEKIGTHERLRLQVVDDVELGRTVEEAGLRGRMLLAQSLVGVRWHDTLRSFVSGIENTVYAGVDFSPVKAAGYAIAIGGLLAGPFWGVLSSKGVERSLYLGSVLSQLGVFVLANAHLGREAWRLAASYPVAALMVCGLLARSTFQAERRGGLVWRGTFYSLEILREARRTRSSG